LPPSPPPSLSLSLSFIFYSMMSTFIAFVHIYAKKVFVIFFWFSIMIYCFDEPNFILGDNEEFCFAFD
jgi:hypothetical protein